MGDRKVAPQPAQLRISGIYFSFYSTEEVERLSVVEVREAASFDTLGHAQPGGLYDPRLGPCEPNDPPCTTCSSNFTNCPGHPGHICLPLPAFHPLLYFTTLKLLRGSCLFCHRVMCSANTLAMRSFLVRLALVDQGRLTDVDRVQELLDGATGAGSTATVQDLEQELNAFIGVGESSVKDEGHQLNRHRVDAREKLVSCLVREFCNDQLFKARVKCPHCSSRQPKYRNEFCRTIVLDFTVGNKKEAEKNQRDPRSYAMEMEEEEAKDELDEVEEAGGTVKEQSAEEKAAAEVAMLRWLREQGGAEVGIDAQLRAAAADQTAQLVWTAHEVRQQLRRCRGWYRRSAPSGCRRSDGPTCLDCSRGPTAAASCLELDSVLLGAVFPMFKEPRINAALTTKTEGGNEGSREVGMERLFVSSVLVSPSRFRPVRFLAGDKFDHPHTAGFKRLIEESHLVSAILQLLNGVKSPALEDLITNKLPRSTTKENVLRLRTALSQMQDRINLLFDQDLNKLEPKQIPGLRQILEKKEGLFRMNMMGKRVNFCARTVITPDPFLAVDEIGVPSVFSKRLTFPEYVNELNLPNLRRLVVDGPDAIHGANFVHMSSQGRQVRLNPSDAQSRKALASRLHAADPARDLKAPPTVLRHLRNGDVMMMNRQPTLHKPSIMGHKARILTGQKAFRMNYAPCKAYNADFDGDEMNGHFTQDFLARAETAELGAVARNYLVPKDGTPILGLIQDHVISASLLSLRGSRFTKADYNALLLSAFPVISHRLRILPPAYIKPGPFWTGKQIISSVIINVLPKDQPALNLDGKAKTSEKNWETPDGTMPLISELTESKVVIRAGELVQGIFDKAHFGATQFGLIHCVLELYGPQVGANLLSAFSRLFTTYLRIHGFSLGVRDILVQPGPDHRRTKIIRRLRECGIQVVMNAFNLEEVEESGERWDEDKLRDLLQLKYTTESEDVKQLDFNMKQATDKFNGKINSAIIPQGLVAPFPLNGLQLMIQAGAKGTMVNAIQISCMIGQIELEGQRPPLSASGRTLPSFKPYDVSPRAGGFVDGRFLTGIPPQELFFHTMAGREGLIDTAVKTSRSGYLQRCIIKHLEGLSVRYDHSVRDADGSLIQFDYGEDGLDVGKSRFLNTSLLRFLADNAKVALASTVPLASDPKGKPRRQPSLRQIKPSEVALTVLSEIQKGEKERKVGQRESAFLGMCAKEGLNGSVGVGTNGGRSEGYKEAVAAWRKLEPKKRAKLERRHGRRPPDPLTAFLHRTSHLAALPDSTLDVVSDDNIKKAVPKASPKDIARLRQAFYWKALRAFAEPGENVGLLASQSIGEPSTQMTLNTFHFAGRGEMNVTLGIPRLREILMVASKTIKTPTSETPFKEGVTEAAKLGLKQALDRVLLKDVLKSFCVTEAARLNSEEEFWYITLLVEIKSPKKRSPEAPTIPNDQVLLALEKGLYKRLGSALLKRQEEAANLADLAHKAMKTYADEVSDAVQASRAGPADGNDGDDSDADVVGGGEDGDGISGARLRARQNDAGEYEGEEEEAVAFAAPDSDQENAGDEDGASVAMSETEDNGPGASSTPAPPKVLKEMNPTRINAVTRTNRLISDYSYDARRSKWAKCTFKMPLNKGRLDVKAIFERELKHFIVRTVPGIEKCFLPKDENVMRTAGVNLQELFKYGDVLDLNRVHTNDVHLVASTYGIEAAARVLVAEVKKVFGGYGIVVDNRHLSLVGDYLLYSGAYRAFNRSAMASTASTLQKMTYESTTKFLREAILHGYSDSAQSPSARLVVGETVGGGTGAFDLRLPLRSLFNAQPKSVSAQKANTLAK